MGHQRRRALARMLHRQPPGARRPLRFVFVLVGLLLLGCGCGTSVVFGVVRSATHHR